MLGINHQLVLYLCFPELDIKSWGVDSFGEHSPPLGNLDFKITCYHKNSASSSLEGSVSTNIR